jgi:hypothetical protein
MTSTALIIHRIRNRSLDHALHQGSQYRVPVDRGSRSGMRDAFVDCSLHAGAIANESMRQDDPHPDILCDQAFDVGEFLWAEDCASGEGYHRPP